MSNTIKVVICDDEEQHIDELTGYINKYENVEIHSYTEPQSLINSGIVFDIALLDIEMNEYNGFDMAEYIYGMNEFCVMAFYSNHSQYAIKGYKYHIYRYILKDEPAQIKEMLISEIFLEYGRRCKRLALKQGNSRIYIQLHDIYYIESLRKLITIHTDTKDIVCHEPLKRLEKECIGFIRVHKSFLVNAAKIRSVVTSREIELNNGVVIPIGKRYTDNLKKLLKLS